MANRIAERLGAWASAPEDDLDKDLAGLLGRPPDTDTRGRARGLFARVLDSGMNIQTIHAFCQSLLGRFPLEAGMAPHFAVMDERDANEMLAAAREDVLARARKDEALARALASLTAHVPRDHLLRPAGRPGPGPGEARPADPAHGLRSCGGGRQPPPGRDGGGRDPRRRDRLGIR